MNKPRIFLGGTCNESTWRDKLIKLIQENGNRLDWFNPVVDDWTEECQKKELEEREKCDYCLYVITPKMTGVYSIAEVIDDSNKRPNKTIFCYLDKDEDYMFDYGQMKSLDNVAKMVEGNGGKSFKSLEEIVKYLVDIENTIEFINKNKMENQ